MKTRSHCRKILELLQKDIKPRDIMTKAAFKNALTIVMALGGSTNAVLHFLAIARSVNVELTLDDFQKISDQTPLIGDLKPSGRYVMEDLHKVAATCTLCFRILQHMPCYSSTASRGPKSNMSLVVNYSGGMQALAGCLC